MSSEISFTVFKGSKSGEIVQSTYNRGALVRDEVLVSITASGLCGTDLHYRKADMALGHEGVGVVKAVGPDVKLFKPGDRVGWGYLHESCGHCDKCLSGRDNYCPERHMYGEAELHQGSFGTAAVWRENYLFSLPDGLTDEEAAPLQCGGITVFTPLFEYEPHSTARVGIIGVGGLGHLAIQFSSKMGRDTIVFSGTESKKEEALKLGANEFYAVKGKDKLDIGQKLDMLIVTTSAVPDWNLYLPLLTRGGVIVPLSVGGGNLEIPYMPVLLNGIRIQGGVIGPRATHKKMLEFAARHGIKPVMNKFDLSKDGIEKAMKTLDEGKMRYRGVLIQPNASRL